MSLVFFMGVLIMGVAHAEGVKGLKTATFAGGCFWCMQPPFDHVEGVVRTTVGYTGGTVPNPTYEEVSSGHTGHKEAVEVVYDPAKVAYEELVKVFWTTIDPTDEGGQFADRGSQYQTAIFYHDDEQKAIAEQAKKELNASGHFKKPVATVLLPAKPFYPAEEYHQKYYLKSSQRYNFYKNASGRKAFQERVWDKK